MNLDEMCVFISCDACGWKSYAMPNENLTELIEHVRTSRYWLCAQTEIILRGGVFIASRYTGKNIVRFTKQEALELDVTKQRGVYFRKIPAYGPRMINHTISKVKV